MSTERRASLFPTLDAPAGAVLLTRYDDQWRNLPVAVLIAGVSPSVTFTTGRTLLAAETGTTFAFMGSTPETLTLPVAVPGLRYHFYLRGAIRLQVTPQPADLVVHPTTGNPSVAGKYIWSAGGGSSLTLTCFVTGEWAVQAIKGTWSIQA